MCRKPNRILLQLIDEDNPIILAIWRTTVKTPYSLIKLFNLVNFKLKTIQLKLDYFYINVDLTINIIRFIPAITLILSFNCSKSRIHNIIL